MVTENDSEKKVTLEKKSKASAGAWWKSTAPEQDESLGSTPGSEAADAETKKPAKRRPARKKIMPDTSVEPINLDEQAPPEMLGEGSGLPAIVKSPRKRSPRKKKARVQASADTNAAVAVDGPFPEEKSGSENVDAEQSAEMIVGQDSLALEASATETVSSVKRKTTQRKNRRNRKSAAKNREKTQQEETSADFQHEENLAGVAELAKQHRRESSVAEEAGDRDWRDDDLVDDEWETNYDSDEPEQDIPLLDDEPEEQVKRVSKLLINAEEPEECRLALLENGRLESIHVSTVTRAQNKNNIYKARIVAIEANLQAAFVDYGTEKNGFLPFSEIHPEYYKEGLSEDIQKLVEAHHWKRLSITDVMEKGQEVLAQVVKEEVGKKGANMTTYLSLPGRCVVLMPGSDSSGISRRIVGEERRSQLRNAMNEMEIPEGIGWIVRTASVDITKAALARDVGYLLRLWEEIKKKGQTLEGIGQLYEDHQSVLRFLREHFDPSIEEILVDDQTALEQVKEFVALLPENQQNVKVRLHKGSRPIFNQFSVEDQIESIYQPKVNLPSGGSIVIDPTEALVAIDVNSGSTSKGKNFEATIFQANMEAAVELARQLRLRDLGGLIVIDFIDMRSKKNIREVERQVKMAMKRDKAKVDISRISKFGLMQISRQKLGAPIEAGNYQVCQHCKGRGLVRSIETLALFYLRRIQTGASRKNVERVECHFPLDVAQYLLNNKRHELYDLEEKYAAEIAIIVETAMKPADNEIVFHKAEKEASDKKQA
jgi:ribonuclease E